MIKIIGKIPRRVTIACSGGVDSMVMVKFLQASNRKIQLAYFNHDTAHSKKAEKFVEDYASSNKLDLVIGHARGYKKKRESLEEFWRNERYRFFNRIKSNFIITCHHLDDCVETWLMSCFHGKGKLIPYCREPNIYRPFLLTESSTIQKFAKNKKMEWVEDPTNSQVRFSRNQIRHNIIPEVLKVNPGIRKVIRKKILELYKDI